MLIKNAFNYLKKVDLFKAMAKGIDFPLLGYKGNVLMSKSGLKTYSYELIANDLEQVLIHEHDKFYRQLISFFNKTPNGAFFKYLFLNDRIFINTNLKKINIPFCQLIPLDDPLNVFFGYANLYSDVSHGSDFLKFNGQYLKIINFDKLSEDEIFPEELSVFGEYMVQFEKKNPWIIRHILDVKRNLHLPNLTGIKRNIKSEKAYEDIENVMEDIIEGHEMIFNVMPSILIRSNDYCELNRKTDLILKKLEEMGHVPHLETDGLGYFFQKLLFGVGPCFKYRSQEIITSFLVNLLPVSRDYLMDDGFEIESISGRCLFYDLFSGADNANLWICGPSGKGKSYLAQYIQDYYIEKKVKVLILEYGKSHEKLCKWHNAVLFNQKANFLQFKCPYYLKDLVLNIIGEDEKFSKMEQGKLFEIIEKGIEGNLFNSNAEFIDYLEGYFKGIHYYFASIREYFTDEIVRFDAQVIYCDIKDYPEEIKAPMIIYLFQWFKSWEGRKIFVLDEITKYVKDDFKAESISDFARNKRKEGGSIFCITQHINDIIRYPFLDVIFENSAHKIFFEHDSEIKVELNPMLEELISELGSSSNFGHDGKTSREFSEFVISKGKALKIGRLRRDNLYYEIFTSNKEETDAFNQYVKDVGKYYPNFRERLERYVELKYGL